MSDDAAGGVFDGSDNGTILIGRSGFSFVTRFSVKSNGNLFAGGNVGIGIEAPTSRLQLPNQACPGGCGLATAWQTYSSGRWKTNIRPIEQALSKVGRLRGVSFDWKEKDKHDIGMIAEEVGEVIPEVVTYE